VNYVGLDVHKRYSVLCAVSEKGRKLKEARIEGNSLSDFSKFFARLKGPSKVVFEAGWNWGSTYDLLKEVGRIREIVMAHPSKTRLIAAAEVKTDELDAFALGTLLRGNLVAQVHIPSKLARARKNLIRQRMYWVRLRTMLRNRIQALLDRQRELELPQCSNIFTVKGLRFLRSLQLAEPESTLLGEQLILHDLISMQIRSQEKRIVAEFAREPMTQYLLSVPGIGDTLAALIAGEVGQIKRFSTPAKLCAYAGLVPTTRASGGKFKRGRQLRWCNKRLRWAFTEASWTAAHCSPYFRNIYQKHFRRGKRAKIAITIVARRLCCIVWHLLSEKRTFKKRQC